jgi:hypothetical protein
LLSVSPALLRWSRTSPCSKIFLLGDQRMSVLKERLIYRLGCADFRSIGL